MKNTTMKAAVCALLIGVAGAPALAQATATASAAAAVETSTLELLKNGDSPRRELRYTLAPRTERAETVDTSEHAGTMNGTAMPVRTETETVIATVKVGAPEGGISKLTITPDSENTASAWLAGDTTYTVNVNASGHMTDVKSSAGEVTEVHENNARSMVIRLPEQAVGVGATWRETRIISEQSIRLTFTFTRTITAIRGDVIEIASEGTATAEHNGQPMGGMPPPMKVESITGSGELSGTATIDLAHVLPRAMTESGDLMFEITIGGGPMPVVMTQATKGSQTVKRLDSEG